MRPAGKQSPYPCCHWLICSILQYMALQDGPCHATLSTTSSMALRAQALNGFYLARGNQLPKTPWDLPWRTQPPIGNGAKSTTSTCIGLGKPLGGKREAAKTWRRKAQHNPRQPNMMPQSNQAQSHHFNRHVAQVSIRFVPRIIEWWWKRFPPRPIRN